MATHEERIANGEDFELRELMRKRGRKPKAGDKATQYCVSLMPADAEFLTQLGQGNRSLGIALLVRRARIAEQLANSPSLDDSEPLA